MKKLFFKLLGKFLGSKLKLEDNMEDSKKWYKSRSVWAGVVAVLVTVYNSVGANLGPQFDFSLPVIPEWVFAVLGGIGVYGRVDADKKIG